MQANEKHFLYRLERENIPREAWIDFISTYVQQVIVGPWLVPGSVIIINQLELWHPEAQYGIVLYAGDYRGRTNEIKESLLHELIHIALDVIGLKEHPEEHIERLCKKLAKKYPFIIDIFEEVFPQLKLDEESIANAFYKPIKVFLTTP